MLSSMWTRSAGLARHRPARLLPTALRQLSTSTPRGAAQTLTEKIVEKYAVLEAGKPAPRPGDYVGLSP